MQIKDISYSTKVLDGERVVYTQEGISNLANLISYGSTYVLEVKIGETKKYIRLEIDVDKFEKTKRTPANLIEDSLYKLSTVLDITYDDGEPITLSEMNFVNIDFDSIEVEYGDGILTRDGGAFKDSEGQTILEIFDDETRRALYLEQKKSGTVVTGKKVGRNDPCPCGSGKKYKKCCGR